MTRFLMLLFIFACKTAVQEESVKFETSKEQIRIVFFHMDQRCDACGAVEKETIALHKESYREQLLDGRIRFLS